PSLIATLGDEVKGAYAEVAGTGKEIGKLRSEIVEQEKIADGPDASAKADATKKIAELKDQVEKLKAGYEPKKADMLGKLGAEAGKSPDEVKKIVGIVLVNLKRAVEDAKVAN